ncbi:UBX domain-containing protein 11 [Histomonas meleagridis]|uniref:UBX domain-containing protein 11 n=1 Tax=Histomonas meleagridis TaxID=135588 RepID=UPI00355A5DEF|nr:UBX domain-containing protein 11 [Histomonas meleagridis]KAH0798235.1 UBX domain-containing protein 11 [Histomonas meleagridis]
MSSEYKGNGAMSLSKVPLSGIQKKTIPNQGTESDLKNKLHRAEVLCAKREHKLQVLINKIEAQKEHNSKLQNQINEMKQFLKDYGLEWAGGPAPTFGYFPNGPIDMDLFNERVKDLNQMAERDISHNYSQNQAPSHKVTVIFENEGFTVNKGQFRPYIDNGMFIQDIMDGFFPSEFQKQFPNGVILKVIDNRKEDIFKGTSRRLIESAKSKRANKELGSGDGRIKVQFPDGSSVVIKTEKTNLIRQIRRIIKFNFDVEESFELCAPPSTKVLNDDDNIELCKLYPRGMLFVTYGNEK